MSGTNEQTTCAEGFTLCRDQAKGEVCVDLQNDDNYCGNCGSHCRVGYTCVNGECVPV